MTPRETALLLIASTEAAILNGVKHYDKNGNFLQTSREIIEELTKSGEVTLDESKRIDLITTEQVLAKLKERYNE